MTHDVSRIRRGVKDDAALGQPAPGRSPYDADWQMLERAASRIRLRPPRRAASPKPVERPTVRRRAA